MPEQLNLRRAGDALVRDSVPYRPFDQERKLGSPPWKSSAPEVQAWEAAHGHDARLKCYPELGCQLVEIALQAEVERLRAEVERLHRFVGWVAGHRLVKGTYADADHPYDEWVTPDGTEADLDEIHERACEALTPSAAVESERS